MSLPFSPRNLIHFATSLLTNPRYFWALASLVIIGDVILTELVIRFVPCQQILRSALIDTHSR
jgi:alpha-1,3-mannosyltransferase